jgi:Sugar kinases, ribokinase family
MRFIGGSGKINIDLIYGGLPRLPEEGEELWTEDFNMRFGGGAPGTIIGLKRLGIPVRLATFWGDDPFSAFAGEELQKEGVAPLNLYKGDGFPLNLTTAIITPSDRSFVSYAKDFARLDDSLLFSFLKGAEYIIMERRSPELYRALKNSGSKLVLDTGWDEDLSFENYREWFSLADYFLPNRREALKLTGEAEPLKAAKILSEYFRDVVIKLDKEGAFLYSGGEGKLISGFPEFKPVDSTGAGDAFDAGFLYGLFRGYPLEKAVLCGNAAGGKCITAYGCLTESLTEDEMEILLVKSKR